MLRGTVLTGDHIDALRARGVIVRVQRARIGRGRDRVWVPPWLAAAVSVGGVQALPDLIAAGT